MVPDRITDQAGTAVYHHVVFPATHNHFAVAEWPSFDLGSAVGSIMLACQVQAKDTPLVLLYGVCKAHVPERGVVGKLCPEQGLPLVCGIQMLQSNS